jgi:hypothetical protein
MCVHVRLYFCRGGAIECDQIQHKTSTLTMSSKKTSDQKGKKIQLEIRLYTIVEKEILINY